MIKSIDDAKIIDLIPKIVANEAWAKAFSLAYADMHKKTLSIIRKSQVYTNLDNVDEETLDALAVNLNVAWYDTTYQIDVKRRIIKTAYAIRRMMGTVAAVEMQANAIYPGTMLEEWFEWGGTPGTFRLYIDITNTNNEPAIAYDVSEMVRRIASAKRFSQQLESLSYMVKRGIIIKKIAEKWAFNVPFCGMIYCGVYWTPSTLGYTEHRRIAIRAEPAGFNVLSEFTGTLPDIKQVGYSVCGKLRAGGVASSYNNDPIAAGEENTGTKPNVKTLGYTTEAKSFVGPNIEATSVSPELTGTLPEESGQT